MTLNRDMIIALIAAHRNDIELIEATKQQAINEMATLTGTILTYEIKMAECEGATTGQLVWLARTERYVKKLRWEERRLQNRIDGCDVQRKDHAHKVWTLERKLELGAKDDPTVVTVDLLKAERQMDRHNKKSDHTDRAARKSRARDVSLKAMKRKDPPNEGSGQLHKQHKRNGKKKQAA